MEDVQEAADRRGYDLVLSAVTRGRDERRAVETLLDSRCEALILIGASGFSYEEAAQIANCAVGTVKSRVNRARTRLLELLSVESVDAYGPDRTVKAIFEHVGINGSWREAG